MQTIDEEVQELQPAWGTPEYEAARRGTDPKGANFTAQRSTWPTPGVNVHFRLENADDPHNPSNRSRPLNRRKSDR